MPATAAFVVALIAVEAALTAPGHVLAAQLADAILLLLMLQIEVLPDRLKARFSVASRTTIRALVLVPLIRVFSIGLPLRDGSSAVSTLVVALIAGICALRMMNWLALGRAITGRAGTARRSRALLGGLALGLVAYLLDAPALWSDGAAADRIVVGLIAAAAMATAEELVFRGAVQLTLERAAGFIGIAVSVLLFTATYFGAGSAALVLMAAFAGMVFACVTAYTRALRGAITAHVCLALSAGGLWPVLLGRRTTPWIPEPVALVLLAFGIVVTTWVLAGIETRDEPTS
jgi:membrane protease YdiL (CAAX protease family)